MIKAGTKFVVHKYGDTEYTISKVYEYSCDIKWNEDGFDNSVSYKIQEVEKYFKDNIWINSLAYDRRNKLDRLKNLWNNNA
jgi:hypothetical protein